MYFILYKNRKNLSSDYMKLLLRPLSIVGEGGARPTSSKLLALLASLRAMKRDDPTAKAVVFT